MRIPIGFLFLISLWCAAWAHQYHVAIAQVDYNTETSTLQVAIRLHDEDVELFLDHHLPGSTDLERDLDQEAVKELLVQYVSRSFSLQHQEVPVRLAFVGQELERDALWVYLESAQLADMPELTVKNTLFLELFEDQSNIVHYSKDNQVVESTVLNKLKRAHTFEEQ